MMTRGLRRFVPLVLAGVVGPALALAACSSAQPVVVIPGAIRQVTLSMSYGLKADGRKPPPPVTITDSAKVSEVARLVTDQPPFPRGKYICLPTDGLALKLTFRSRPGGPALARATLALDGCEGTQLTVGAKHYNLGLSSARTIAAKVLKVTAVPWKLPPASL